MRRFLSVLFVGCLMMISTLAPRVTFAVAPAPNPAPTPAAFTGGDTSYQAMCAIAQIAVAAPAPDGGGYNQTTDDCGELTGILLTPDVDGDTDVAVFKFKVCILDQWMTMYGYVLLDDTTAMNLMGEFFSQYDTALTHCPAAPVCMSEGTKWYAVNSDAGMPGQGCPQLPGPMYIENNYNVITVRAWRTPRLMLQIDDVGHFDDVDAWRPFKRPPCEEDGMGQVCTEPTGGCTTNP